MSRIAFIGLGSMGAPMAGCLVNAGHDVVGYDLAVGSRTTAVKRGIRIGSDAKSCVEGSDFVITMLPTGKDVLTVWSDVIASAKSDALFINSSTIDIGSARHVHDLASARGILSLDAPVSGGVGGAESATLTFMVGGSSDAFDRVKPVLEQMGKRLVHCGAAGSGQAAKICNNMILGVSMIAVSEAFILAERLGLSHQALFDVASTSSGQCWSLNSYCPVPGLVPGSPANNSYKPGFSAALMLKDLDLAQKAAASVGAETALGRDAAEFYAQFSRNGGALSDFSAIINFVREQPRLSTISASS